MADVADMSIPPKDVTPEVQAPKPKVGKRNHAVKTPRRPVMVRPYPLFTLEKALELPRAIKDHNAGNPWPPTEAARALGMGTKSSSLDFMARSSALYGLTSGTRAASYISLEKLGRDIMYAPSEDAEVRAKRLAFLNVDIFSKVLEYYKGNSLPELNFLSNTLVSEFQLPVELHDEFRKLFIQNCEFVGIGKEWHGLGTPAGSSTRRSNSSPDVVIHAAGENPEGKKCFVIMPFSERLSDRPEGFFDEVFESLIKPAAEAAGFDVYTANKDGSDVIQSTIVNELMDADLVIADLTDHNPNVLFELGVRMAREKPIAIMKTGDTGGIFDVDNLLRVFEYSRNLWPSTIKSDVPRLEGHVRATWEGRNSVRSYFSILRREPTERVS